MKPVPSFTLHRSESLRDALRLLGELYDPKLLAGGTDLIPLLREGACSSRDIVDIGSLAELRFIHDIDGRIHVGAGTRLQEIADSELIADKAPMLQKASLSVGSPQISNLGTIGGNLCNASPAADTAPALLALDATISVQTASSRRDMQLTGLFKGPKTNSLAPDEMLTEISFRTPPFGAGMDFQKLGRRNTFTISIVNAAAYLELENGVIEEARLSLGAVAPTPIRLELCERQLEGKSPSQLVFEDVAASCRVLASPVDDHRASADYRREMSGVLIKRALAIALERARRHGP